MNIRSATTADPAAMLALAAAKRVEYASYSPVFLAGRP